MPKQSAWSKGVELYAQELLEQFRENYPDSQQPTAAQLLNGAGDWKEYSYGGSALIYDWEIAERLCNPTELKRTDGGRLQPNARETWLDVQARALFQASRKVLSHE